MSGDGPVRDLVELHLKGRTIQSAFVGARAALVLKLHGNEAFSAEGGYLSVMVNCVWRVRKGRNIVATWRDLSGRRRAGCLAVVRCLAGATVRAVVFHEFLSDLTLNLHNGTQIDVFVDMVDAETSDDNYFIRAGKHLLACKWDGALLLEEADRA